jgi:hypothetical protein
MTELFKPIPSYPRYAVSAFGTVKRLPLSLTTSRGVIRQLPERVRKTYLDPRGYLRVTIDGSPRLVHRLIAEAFLPNPDDLPCVDHKDGSPLNCCLANLRWATQQSNLLNRHKANAKSGFVGVHRIYSTTSNPWVACGKLGGKSIHLGVFPTAYEAAAARRTWELSVGATTSQNIESNRRDY